MIKALNRVVSLAVPSTGWLPPTPALQLIALTSNGDLRSAVNSLQMLCNRANVEQEKGKNGTGKGSLINPRRLAGTSQMRTASGRGRRGGKGAKLDVSDSLRAV